MHVRKQRIQRLSRENKGRRSIPAFVEGLSTALAERVDAAALATLENTDSLWEISQEGYRRSLTTEVLSYRRFFDPRRTAIVLEISRCLGAKLSADNAFLLIKDSEYCGAVRLRVQTVLARAESVLAFDGDSIWLVSEDRQEGLLLDHNPDDKERTHELTVWGSRWAPAAHACNLE